MAGKIARVGGHHEVRQIQERAEAKIRDNALANRNTGNDYKDTL